MPIISHSRDMSLAPTITQLLPESGGTVKAALGRLASSGFSAVQLDATLSGIRPRELDRRARKDLLATLSRCDLRLGGIDLFIPRNHFVDGPHQDRAMQATAAAVEMAADLGRVPLSMALPVGQIEETIKTSLVQSADGCGVRLAVHAEDQLDDLLAWVEQVDQPCLGAAIDPAAILATSVDPVQQVHRFASRLVTCRLCDAGAATQGMRCKVGSGDLDLSGYRIAVDLAVARTGPVILDLRGLADPLAAAVATLEAWDDAAMVM
jgi:sugar phosphate isomerase/epimerase